MLYRIEENSSENKPRVSTLLKQLRGNDQKKIIEDIRVALEELESIRQYFDNVDVPELIEYAIYREKAATARLSYLIQLAKKEG